MTRNSRKAPSRVRIGLVQMACGPDKRQNIARAMACVRRASQKGARIVALQELFSTPYFCQREKTSAFDWAEPIPGPTTEAVCEAARRNKVVVIAPLFEKRARGLYHNSAAVVDADGRLAGIYRKMHIPDDPGFYEKFYFVPGDLGFRAFETRYGRIGVLICWDQWFPEAARLTALQGADILFYPTAIGWKLSRPQEARAYQDSWETIQRSHAIANGVYVAAANRAGREGNFRYWGGSFVADPFGRVVKKLGVGEGILIADCDLGAVEQTRREWPFLRDRRIDSYRKIASRFAEKN